MTTAPATTLELVERFERNRAAYESAHYNETQVRREFIDPLLRSLGWDIDNAAGYAEAYKDVVHEDAIRVAGIPKAPDYSVRIGGTRKFFVEAKRPSVNLKLDPSPAYQLRRYAWSAKLPLSILTDFAELAVYDCRLRPEPHDSAAKARVLYLTCDEYPARWDELASVFARDAVLRGSFDAYAEAARAKRGTTEVDDAFLAEIETWRDELARNIALRNPTLSARDLNFAVQTTIDRIVFLRICEDRGLENYGTLREAAAAVNVYSRLMALFQRADARYNSGLFHFRRERGRSEPDDLTPSLSVDDKSLRAIINRLYYPASPYQFSVISADILGQVYERFLGRVISLTPARRVRIEDKPDVKKAGGVYYTPVYVVNFIVAQALGSALADRDPKRIIGGNQRESFRVLDPACGSGSFLIAAYQYLLDWFLSYYTTSNPQRWARGPSPRIYRGSRGGWRLTTRERKRIVTDHIFGVDIDPQAVEVTKLSLMLKVLEGESDEMIQLELRLFNERALPDLDDNIKCGNSLIGPDFYDEPQMRLLSQDRHLEVNVFDWEEEFPVVFGRRTQGFDAVIGNPPWGARFTDEELSYARAHYRRVIARMIDSYIYFLDRAFQLAKEGAPVGFIVPGTILNQTDARPVRELVLKRGLSTLVNLGEGVFGAKVSNTSTILISEHRADTDRFLLQDLSALPRADRAASLSKAATASTAWGKWKRYVAADPHSTFFAGPLAHTALLARLRKAHSSLGEMVSGKIQRGVSPDVAAAHVVDDATAKAQRLERELLRPSISADEVRPYHTPHRDQYVIYTTRDTRLSRYPNAQRHLRQFKHLNTCREVTEEKHPWWGLHRPRDPAIFRSPKFIGLTTTKEIQIVYDESGSFTVTDAMYVLDLAGSHDPWAFMAVMHSELALFLYRVANQGESRVIPQIKATKLGTLPVPSLDIRDATVAELASLSRSLHDLHAEASRGIGSPQEKAVRHRQIRALERRVNDRVYLLYGLKPKEIRTVERAMAVPLKVEGEEIDGMERALAAGIERAKRQQTRARSGAR